ncbi:MAG: type IV pilus secretin PilQ [Deltaproteobacteria bacterium]|nr:type IV pilus secretin PilQ [Deltaproteobacteria bacterium]
MKVALGNGEQTTRLVSGFARVSRRDETSTGGVAEKIKAKQQRRKSMGNRGNGYKKGLAPFLCLAISILVLKGCATQPIKQVPSEESQVPKIESVDVRSFQHKAILEIKSDRTTHFTAFQLVDPPRIILDVRGAPAKGLPMSRKFTEGSIRGITIQEGKSQAMTTRVVVRLEEAPLEYRTQTLDGLIRLILTPKKIAGEKPLEEVAIVEKEEMKRETIGPYEPRIFFKPKADNGLNQVLGIDFTMLNRGKSRLIITTEQRVPYRLEQKGIKDLLLTMERSTIPPLLMRRLESIYFEGAIERVKASVADSKASMLITLKEMVPFHVDQTDQAITIDFGPTLIKPPEKKIAPVKKTEKEAEISSLVAEGTKSTPEGTVQRTAAQARMRNVAMAVQPPALPDFLKKKYTGTPMTLDFVNADVTNILRLIAEVSNLNIVWGPEVKGNVSMRLKNVPWDQALDLILANNNLAMRKQGNVIWITTKAQMAKIEAEERRKRAEYEAELARRREAERKAREVAKQLEPLLTEYLPLDFATTTEIKAHLEPLLSERGKLSEDARTNTIIITDIREKIEEAKKIVQRFDAPDKQVVIEARIVEAKTNFARDLGIQWGAGDGSVGINAQRRDNTGVSFGIPTDATGYTSGGDNLVGGTFSSNKPSNWASNLGFTFGYLTSSALGAVTLDARLALSEAEGTAKIISAPRVIARKGVKATITRGSTFYLEAAENVEPTPVEAKLSLAVTPTAVSYNDYVTMEVELQDEKQEGSRGKSGKTISTELMVKSGETIVIGGIYKEDRTDDESGIPYLRKIPVLGWLFKAQRGTYEKTELLIFITPTVLPPPGQARARAL